MLREFLNRNSYVTLGDTASRSRGLAHKSSLHPVIFAFHLNLNMPEKHSGYLEVPEKSSAVEYTFSNKSLQNTTIHGPSGEHLYTIETPHGCWGSHPTSLLRVTPSGGLEVVASIDWRLFKLDMLTLADETVTPVREVMPKQGCFNR